MLLDTIAHMTRLTMGRNNRETEMTTFNGGTATLTVREFATRAEYRAWIVEAMRAIPEGQEYGPCVEKVRRGYESPYRFGREMRKLIGDDDAAVMEMVAGPDAGAHFTEPAPNAAGPIRVALYRVTH